MAAVTSTHRLPGPFQCQSCGQTHPRGCRGHRDKAKTEPCRNWPRRGAEVCTAHGGNAPQVIARAAVRAEVLSWGLRDMTADPGEVLLRLVTQSAARCDLYATLLGDAYDAAERLREATGAGADRQLEEAARQDLERVLNHGGVSALIGHTFSATKDGDIFATGEAIRGLARLEGEERDRCAGFAAKAIAAGIAERQVRVAERHVELVNEALTAALAEMGLGLDQQLEARRRVAGHLRIAAG